MKYLYSLLIALAIVIPGKGIAQDWTVKNNLLYDATTTLNLGFEFGLGEKTTLDISGNYNPWKFHDVQWKHWLIQPEFRFWFCERFYGHFIGIHGHYAEYNVGGLSLNEHLRHNRYQGHLYGGGVSYGYQWLINDRWSMEATVGVGYARLNDKKYPIADCGEVVNLKGKNYFGPTKIGLSIIYVIR